MLVPPSARIPPISAWAARRSSEPLIFAVGTTQRLRVSNASTPSVSSGRSASTARIAASRAIAIFETSLRFRSMLPERSTTRIKATLPCSRRGGGAGEIGSISSRTVPA
jgi:hypothetical protein